MGLEGFGFHTARQLFDLGNEVLAIDGNSDLVEEIADNVTQAVTGDCRDEKVLRSLGVADFDCAVVSFADGETNILVTSLLKQLGVKTVVTKSTSDLYTRVLLQVGADKVVFPEKDMGIKTAQNLASTHEILDFIELSDKLSLVELRLPEKWIGKDLVTLNVRREYGITVVAIKHGDTGAVEVSVDPRYAFREGDVLVVVGSNTDIAKVSG